MKHHTLFAILILLTACRQQTSNSEVDKVSKNIYHEYFENGKLKLEVEIINGLQNGTLKEYYKNGQLHISQDWKMGDPVGDYKLYLDNGKLLYHKKSYYVIDSNYSYKTSEVLFKDTVNEYMIRDRIVIKDIVAFKKSVKITSPTKTLTFGQENKIEFFIPNVELPNCSVENATICPAGKDDTYIIKPKFADKNVFVRFSAKLNDTIINFEPIELKVINNVR